MLDRIVENERRPDVVQISGGEPTLHPELFRILDLAKQRPIQHLMVNTNGIRIAREHGFAERLAEYMPGFELYLQFDSFEAKALQELRGADLTTIRMQAIEKLNRLGLSTSLVVTLKRGVNDHEIGRIVEWGLEQPCVRGVVLQPIQAAGRYENFNPARDRLTLTEVRRNILEQTKVFRPEDIIPVPCHPDSLAMAYALKLDGRVVPLTGMIDPKILIEGGRNTIVFEADESVQKQLFRLFSTNHSPISTACTLSDLLCCIPRVAAPKNIDYSNVFRVIIMQFIDAWAFDVRSIKKTCVHIAHPDGQRIVPFDTYNLFYRDDLEKTVLEPLAPRTRNAPSDRQCRVDANRLAGEHAMQTIFTQPPPEGAPADSVGRGVGLAIVCQVCSIVAGFGLFAVSLRGAYARSLGIDTIHTARPAFYRAKEARPFAHRERHPHRRIDRFPAKRDL